LETSSNKTVATTVSSRITMRAIDRPFSPGIQSAMAEVLVIPCVADAVSNEPSSRSSSMPSY
jgi:hypothetical protein